MKHEVWFKHDNNARNDQKMLGIRIKYGLMGYGIYFCIIEMLRASQNYTLKKDYNVLAYDLPKAVFTQREH
jgi:hypothetical protein